MQSISFFRVCFAVLTVHLAALVVVVAAAQAEDSNCGITAVTQGPVDLVVPRVVPKAEAQRYGLAYPFQVGPKTAALLVNLRMEGKGVGDFENGSDVLLFDDLKTISASVPVRVSRNDQWADPATGEKRIFVTFPQVGGFVPFGARREDGTPHPHAGSGFAFCTALGYLMKENGAPRPDVSPLARISLRQFRFDGKRFWVAQDDSLPPGKHLWTDDSRWRLPSPGMTMAIPDGDDLLQPVKASGKGHFCGVARWACRAGRWRPASFLPVQETQGLMEPSLARDAEGALLFTVRNGDRSQDDAFALRVWRSRDGGASWARIVDVPATLDAGPRAIGTAADGTPFVVGNPVQKDRSYFREALWLWPLNAGRSALEPPLIVRDGPSEFGPAPRDTPWRADHPNSTLVRLADGQWHSVLAFRFYRNDLLGPQGAPKEVQEVSGAYIEEVLSRGAVRPAWHFTE